jgi:hypothetical protein
MAIELQCGECSAVLVADAPGTMVACPHCGAHLMVPELAAVGIEAEPAAVGEVLPELESVVRVLSDTSEIPCSEPKTDELPGALVSAPFDAPTEAIPEAVAAELARLDAARLSTATSTATAETQAFALPPAVVSSVDSLAATTPFTLTDTIAADSQNSPGSVNTAPSAETPVKTVSASASAPVTTVPAEMVPRKWFQLALTVCSILGFITLFLGYAVSQQIFRRHQLESLPDLAPPRPKDGRQEVTQITVPFDAPMAPLHTLRLGDSRRFGNLVVTALRIEKCPIEFVHYDPENKTTQPPSVPVWKLVLRVENAGSTPFAPFDHRLIYSRQEDRKNGSILLANNFVGLADEREPKAPRVMMYELPEGSVWDLKGQLCGRDLAPGEAVETFLATDPVGLDQLSGDLIWRVHFRKGHNANSGRGVTTVVEIAFHESEVEA